jgi:N-acetylmuramoyl-L-alanine amidase
MGRGLVSLLSVAVLLGIVAGTYFALDRLVRPALQHHATEDEAVITVATVSLGRSTTTTTPRTDRVISGGANRYETAIAVSKLGFPEDAPALVLVSGDDYAEAVFVTPLAVAYGGPILLVPAEGIETDLSTEIQRLHPSQVFLVGASLPSGVKWKLRDILEEPTVTELAGSDPYETAALVAKAVKAKLGTVSKVVIAPSDGFVEALAVAPLAAAKGWPILLSPRDDKPPGTTNAAIEELGATAALVVGTSTKLMLSEVERQVGADSYETCALIAAYAVTQGMSMAHTAIATGDGFPDALVAGPYLARDKGILLLAKDGRLPPPVLSLLTANLGAIQTLDFIALPGLAEDVSQTGTQ